MFRRIVFIMLAGLFMTVSLMAQDAGELAVPKRVKNKMLALYPQTQEVPVTWSKEGVYFKGALTIMEKPAQIVFDTTGRVIRIEQRIHQTYLPKPILKQLAAEDKDYEIKEIFEFTDAAGKKTYKTSYTVVKTVLYNEDGTVVKEK